MAGGVEACLRFEAERQVRTEPAQSVNEAALCLRSAVWAAEDDAGSSLPPPVADSDCAVVERNESLSVSSLAEDEGAVDDAEAPKPPKSLAEREECCRVRPFLGAERE